MPPPIIEQELSRTTPIPNIMTFFIVTSFRESDLVTLRALTGLARQCR